MPMPMQMQMPNPQMQMNMQMPNSQMPPVQMHGGIPIPIHNNGPAPVVQSVIPNFQHQPGSVQQSGVRSSQAYR